MRRKLSWILLFVIPVVFGSGAAIAADDEKPGWYLDADLASVMQFLASPAARGVHGAAVPVYGLS